VLESSALGPRIRTTIDFMPDGPDATVVTVTESKFPLTGRRSTRPGTECRGTHTLCGLKAYVQFGINLRTGLQQKLKES
jgi:hypothetical protein